MLIIRHKYLRASDQILAKAMTITQNEAYLRICPVHYDVAAPHFYSASSQPPDIKHLTKFVCGIKDGLPLG